MGWKYRCISSVVDVSRLPPERQKPHERHSHQSFAVSQQDSPRWAYEETYGSSKVESSIILVIAHLIFQRFSVDINQNKLTLFTKKARQRKTEI